MGIARIGAPGNSVWPILNRMLMLVRLIIFCFILTDVSACGSAPWSKANDQSSVPPDTAITLSRDGLLIKILADGTVSVEGVAFDFDLARIRMKIGVEEVKNLLRAFERMNYFSLSDRYFDKADGCPQTVTRCTFIAITTSLTLNGRSKSVKRLPYECVEADGSSYPRELVALEKQIEETVDLRRR